MVFTRWDADAFPMPRPDRATASRPALAAPGLPPISLPVVEIITFTFNLNFANSRARQVTPLFNGPAILDELVLQTSLPNVNPPGYFAITVNPAPEEAFATTLQTLQPASIGRSIVTVALRALNADQEVGEVRGWHPPGVTLTNTPNPVRVRQPILETNFSLSLEITSEAISFGQAWGSVRLLTNVDPELLLNFL